MNFSLLRNELFSTEWVIYSLKDLVFNVTALEDFSQDQ